MPATITRTVTWTGTNTTSNPDFEWVNVDGVTWVTRADSSTVNQSDFTIADNGTGAVRSSQWEVRHWNYVNDNTLIDSFTITQSAAGVVATTTTTTQAGTTTTTTQAATTTTTTQAATTTTSTTAAPTTTTSTTLAPLNGILVTSTNVVTVSEVANGTGGSTYADDNSSNSPSQSVTYRLSLDPDTDLTLSNEVYWSTTIPSTSGHQSTTSPYWATGLSVNNSPSIDEAQISFAHVDPNSFTPSTAPSTEEQAGAQAGPSGGVLPTNQMYLIARHPDDISHWVAILVTAPTGSITTTTTTTAGPTFYWSVVGGTDGLGTNAGLSYPAHYNGSSGTSGNLSTTVGDPYVAGPQFHLWAEYLQGGTDITIAPTNGWSQYVLTPTYVDFISASWNSTVGMWKFTFQTDSDDPGFPTDANQDDVANIYNTVTGSSVGYGVIIDATLSCHVAGTVMNLADGSTKLVEDLQVGDVLASYDIAGLSDTGEFLDWSSQINQFSATQTTATVVNIASSSFGKYVNFNNGLTKVTEEHPVLIKDAGNNISFKQVIDVVIGDSFYINGAWVEITSKETVEEAITAYNVDVETDDVYLADGILWHNIETLAKVE